MTIGPLITARRADLSAQIAEVKVVILRLGDIDDALHARVADRLEELIEGCLTALRDLEHAGEGPVAWQRLRAVQKQVGFVSREALGFTQGALLRRSGVGGGFCALADKLLDHFNGVEGKLNWR